MIPYKATKSILNDLIDLIRQLDAEAYQVSLPILSGSSIGKHIRHITEFYQCLFTGDRLGMVDYDKRVRNTDLEQNKTYAEVVLSQMADHIGNYLEDKELLLAVNFDEQLPAGFVKTSFSRELVYNIEHAIHHMALIRIGVTAHFPHVHMDENFGVAYSTIRYQQTKCAP